MSKHVVAVLMLVLVASALVLLGVDIPELPNHDAPAVHIMPDNQGILRQ
ncbi:hypothetical protein [Aestuariispira ectoiniformans]|nr:hypothetical protein [Aestuariispira ectoiniformans]